MKLRPFILAFAIALSACAPSRTVVADETSPVSEVVEEMPAILSNEFYWNGFFYFNLRTGGLTTCYGERTPVIKLNPFWSQSGLVPVIAHEAVHELQVYREGCERFLALSRSNDGAIILEAEAFARANGLRGEALLETLMIYDEGKALGVDSVRVLAAEWL
ncbi:MAG: hypothetical protein KY428_05885 [Bacteroidetes bacterium]|nr:hypothetical protein [Bacteroidota bacterium]